MAAQHRTPVPPPKPAGVSASRRSVIEVLTTQRLHQTHAKALALNRSLQCPSMHCTLDEVWV
jgi:hypothetical protein